MTKISIKKLIFKAIIGINEEERTTKQRISVSISFEYEFAGSDGFIDYSSIPDIVKNNIKKNKYFLLEDALQGLSELILKKFPTIKYLHISIKKPDIFKECIVSASSEWKN